MNILILSIILLVIMCSNDINPKEKLNCYPDKWKVETGKENAFYDLIKKDDFNLTELYLKDCENPHGCTYLLKKDCYFPLSAVKNSNIADLLIEYGANVNKKDRKGQTPLHHAAINNNHKAIDIIKEKGANINEKDIYNRSALHYASMHESNDAIDILLKFNIDINPIDIKGRTPLHYLIIGDEENMSSFTNNDILNKIKNAKFTNKTQSYEEKSSKRIGLLLKLLKHGAIIDKKDKDGFAALHYAAIKNEFYLAEILSQGILDANIRDNYGGTPLHWSSIVGSYEFSVMMVYQLKADINAQDFDGQTPLHWIGRLGDNNKTLFQSEDKNINGIVGTFERKFIYNRIKTSEFLLKQQDIDINIKDNNNNTALDLAIKYKQIEIIDLLKKRN